MALTSTIYRFQIELSDIQRSIYETIDLRVAQHPSESLPYMLTRILAYALNFQEDLAFSTTGLGDPDAAAIQITNSMGGFDLLIEIGSPSARRLHKATKISKAVKVYTYKNPDMMMNDLRAEKIHKVEEIEFYSIIPSFLDEVATHIEKVNRWSLLVDDEVMTLQIGENSISSDLTKHAY